MLFWCWSSVVDSQQNYHRFAVKLVWNSFEICWYLSILNKNNLLFLGSYKWFHIHLTTHKTILSCRIHKTNVRCYSTIIMMINWSINHRRWLLKSFVEQSITVYCRLSIFFRGCWVAQLDKLCTSDSFLRSTPKYFLNITMINGKFDWLIDK